MQSSPDAHSYAPVSGLDPDQSGHVWGPEYVTSRGPADHSPGQVSQQVPLKSGASSQDENSVESSLLGSDSSQTSSASCDVTDEKSSCVVIGCQGDHKKKPIQVPRQQWNKELEFMLAAVGNAVGLGNLWRFPYLCYASGGGAFLVPYFIMLILCGIPLLYMELSVGQYTAQGPVGAMQKLSPFWQGAGMATVMLSFLLCTYYNVILTWAIYYLGASFQDPLPWSDCNNTWNTDKCWDDYSENASLYKPNNTVSPSQEYYEYQVLKQSSGIDEQGGIVWQLAVILNQVLKQSSGIDEQGGIVWQLAVILFFAWVLVYLCLWKGVQWTGKVVYFTATFPYLVIILLIIRGVTLPGADIGIDFYIKPDWELLLTPTVWVNAAAQNFNSIGIAFGSMIAFASYNKKEVNLFKNTLIICVINSATSVLAGFAVFAILGNIAYNQGADVEDVVTDGPGLVFIVYPEAFVTMPFGVAQFFSVLFFFMVICLAIDSQFASVEVVLTTLMDHFGVQLMRYLKRKEVVVLCICTLAFLLGFPNITNGGIYFFKIIDYYSSGISLMLIAFCEVMAICWFYGAKRLACNVKEMSGKNVNIFFLVCWYAVSPLLILVIMIFNWVQYTPVTYGDYVFPKWAEGLGWGLAGLSLICIPIGMVYGVSQANGDNLYRRFRTSLKSVYDTGYELDDATIMASYDKYVSSDIALYKPKAGADESFPMETKTPMEDKSGYI